MKATTAQLLDVISKEDYFSQMWRTFYPREYRKADQYGDPRYAAMAMVSSLDELSKFKNLSSSTRGIVMSSNEMLKYNIPTLFLEKEFFAAACQTTLPKDSTWMDLKLPYEAGLLMLPKNKLRHPTDGFVDFIGYARVKFPIDLSKFSIMVKKNIVVQNTDVENLFVVFTAYHEQYNLPVCSQIRGTGTGALIYNTDVNVKQDIVNIHDIPMTATDDEFLCQLVQITCQVLSLLTVRPQLIEKGHHLGKSKRSNYLQLWSPNIVGRGYKIQRSIPTGTHASPRCHWRRGHIRQQACGPNLMQHHEIWIEPTLVNGSSE